MGLDFPGLFLMREGINMDLKLANRSILNLLELAGAKGEYIETELRHRKIGKTTALIQYAKENGYTVLVGNGTEAKYLEKEFGYRLIKSINSHSLEGLPFFVFDESVTKEQVQELKENGQVVLTGFLKNDDFYGERG